MTTKQNGHAADCMCDDCDELNAAAAIASGLLNPMEGGRIIDSIRARNEGTERTIYCPVCNKRLAGCECEFGD